MSSGNSRDGWGFALALATSVVAHGAVALCQYHDGGEEARVAPFHRGRTTVALRPTVTEPPAEQQVQQEHFPPEQSPPELTPAETPARPAIEHVPAMTSPSPASVPLEPPPADVPEHNSMPQLADARSEVLDASRPPRLQPTIHLGDISELPQPYASRPHEGGTDDAEASVHTLPSPPFPPHLPYAAVRLPLEYTIDTEGRFRDVRVTSGDRASDALIARFIEQRWRATPARRDGRPVTRSYRGHLTFK
jgi:hypothetical protein